MSPESVTREGPWPAEVVDPDSGLNVMMFPSHAGSGMSCIELMDQDDEPVALPFFSYGV